MTPEAAARLQRELEEYRSRMSAIGENDRGPAALVEIGAQLIILNGLVQDLVTATYGIADK